MKKKLALYGVLLLLVSLVVANVFVAGDGHVAVVEDNAVLTEQNTTLTNENKKLTTENQQLTQQVTDLNEQVQTYEEKLNTPPPVRPKSNWNLEVPTND